MVTTTLEDTINRQTYGILGHLMTRQTFWVFIASVLAFLYLTFASDAFFTPGNLFNVGRNCAFVGIIGLGMTAVIITGGIDLSVGSILCVAGMVAGMMMSWNYPIWIAVPCAIARLDDSVSALRRGGVVWHSSRSFSHSVSAISPSRTGSSDRMCRDASTTTTDPGRGRG